MSRKFIDPGEFTWQPIDHAAMTRLMYVLESWRHTRYQKGSRVRGGGIDCKELIFAVMDDLHGRTVPTPCIRVSQDVAYHDNWREAWLSVLAFRHAYPSVVVRDKTIEPGDILLVRGTHDPNSPRKPGHAMIASHRMGVALHADNDSGVDYTAVYATTGILRVYRPLEKHLWPLN